MKNASRQTCWAVVCLALVLVGCGSDASDQEEQEATANHRLKKRTAVIPGTKYCGQGRTARHYDDLGLFRRTDACCRDHDHCPTNIKSRETGFGLYNHFRWTITHCDCDNAFRNCLNNVQGPLERNVARGVINLYFQIFRIRCFILNSNNRAILQ